MSSRESVKALLPAPLDQVLLWRREALVPVRLVLASSEASPVAALVRRFQVSSIRYLSV